MNIGFDGYDIDDFTSAWGATQRNLIDKLISIDRQDVFYVFTTLEGSKLVRSESNIKIVTVSDRKKKNVISRAKSIVSALRENNILLDLYIETCEIAPNLGESVRIFSLVHDFSQGKYEFALSFSRLKGIIYNYLHRQSIKRSQVLFCNSKFTMKQLKKYLQPNQIASVFPHGIDPIFRNEICCSGKFETMIEHKLDPGFFLYVGRVNVRHKNVLTLFRAFRELTIKYPHLVLVLATSKKLTMKQVKYIRKNKLNILILNYLTTDKIACLYKKAIALVFPSVYEGFGIPIIEAQTVGCPVVLNDIDVFREVAGTGGLFFNGSYQNLKEKMEFFLIKENTLPYCEEGKLNAIKYSWEKTAKLICDFINKTSGRDLLEKDTK